MVATMNTWHAASAWLGDAGGRVESNVRISVGAGIVTDVSVGSEVSQQDHVLGGLVIPGLVSAHSHAFHRALRGRSASSQGDFWAWRRPMYDLANQLTPDTYFRLATAVFTEMLLAGISTVGEFHYIHNDQTGRPYDDPNAMASALIGAAKEVGIRLTLIDAAYMTSDVSGASVTRDQRRFADASIGQWHDRVGSLAESMRSERTINVAAAAHSVRAVSATDLGALAQATRSLGLPLHVHVSEQVDENEACLAEYGLSPVGLLDREGFLGPATTLVHATHLTAHDRELVAASSSRVCLCPTTEADLGDGIGCAFELSELGVQVCLGSDSNAIIDIFEEARRVEHHDRLRLMRRGVHRPEALMVAATSGGAESLGWQGGGRIAVGAPADFMAVDTDSLDLAGTDVASLSGLVMAATRASVTDVVVNGRRVVVGGNTTSGFGRSDAATTLKAMSITVDAD